LLRVDFTHTALYDELADRCGVHLTDGRERVSAVVPDEHQRDLLGLAARQAAFRLERLSRTGERTVEWRRTLVRGDRYSFVASWSHTPRDRAPAAPPDDVLVS
jgi:GntR family transcriptional regulator